MNRYDEIIFIDESGKEHKTGKVIGVWYENKGDGNSYHNSDLLFHNLIDINALLSLANDAFGTWKIKNGKVVAA